jgi:putative membrane-bound dehydrogenase-like protein
MTMQPRYAILILLPLSLGLAADPPPGATPVVPRSPRDEQATFRVLPGFKVELVACEPDVVDPVAMAFDEQGRMFVAEMRGYPNAGVATGQENRGRIKCLTDTDGDGTFETCTVYAEGLRFPCSVMPWKGGLLVSNAPDLVYLEDADGDGRSDRQRVLYTGFALDNIQQLVNSLQWGLDNWVHASAGNKGGDIRSAEKPDDPPVILRGRGMRFHPDVPGSLEPTSGGGQYGLAADAFGRWFTATNSQHLRQIVLPDHYLRRNPFLAVPAVTIDIPDHGAACKVHRLSAFEAWRVERTSRRVVDPAFRNWSATEKVPGGFVTSGCSPVVYLADRFPAEYRGNVFVCDPANNLIHRDRLEPNGPATFVARRADDNCEFLASTDNWFRPTWLTVGPDGGLYVLDFYREVIETPLSLPEDIKKRLNLESRDRGRIWRIVPDDGKKPPRPDLRKAPTAELVRHLGDANAWWRLTAQRLLVERQDKSAVPALEALARSAPSPDARVHSLWALEGLHSLTRTLVGQALGDASAEVREHALQLSEMFLAGPDPLRAAQQAGVNDPKRAVEHADQILFRVKVLMRVEDPSPRVRFQLALTLGAMDGSRSVSALALLLTRDGADPWVQTAALSSAAANAPDLLMALTKSEEFVNAAHAAAVLTRLATVIGAQADDDALAQVFRLLGEQPDAATWPVAVLDGLGQGLQHGKRSLRKLWEQPPPALAEAVRGVMPLFRRAAAAAADLQRGVSERATALRRLGHGPFDLAADTLAAALGPQNPPELQTAAVQALAAQDHPKAADLLLEHWDGYGPAVRREAVEALCARPARLAKLLDAVAAKRVVPSQLESARREQLRRHSNAALRQRAQVLFADAGNADRRKVIDDHRATLDLPADPARGKVVFQKNCMTCHRLGDEGHDVGPDLRAVLGNKTREALLADLLDPNREVDPRYVNYQVMTTAGRVVTGLLAVETPASVTLRRADKAEDTILRTQIDSMQATTQSLMPEELEKQLTKQDFADVIAYLLSQATSK